jgi:hypothetical protein
MIHEKGGMCYGFEECLTMLYSADLSHFWSYIPLAVSPRTGSDSFYLIDFLSVPICVTVVAA